MSRNRKLSIVGLMLILLSSVSCLEDRPDGDWDDNIHLSQKKVEFTSAKNSITITTKGKWWWICDVSLNGKHLNLEGMNTSKGNFVINQEEFRIERRDTTEIHIEMTKNTTRTERILDIELEAGDYFDRIEVIQAKE